MKITLTYDAEDIRRLICDDAKRLNPGKELTITPVSEMGDVNVIVNVGGPIRPFVGGRD